MAFVDDSTVSAGGSTDSNAGGISRRTVVKVGANSLWAVPLIQVVAAAPAVACSAGGGVTVSGTAIKATKDYAVNATLTSERNTALAPAIIYVTRSSGTWDGATVSNTTTGWTYAPSSGNTVTFTNNAGLAICGTLNLISTITAKDARDPGTITITGSAGGVTAEQG